MPEDSEQKAEDKNTQASWQYSPEVDDVPLPESTPVEAVSWTASEYIEHSKGAGWFVMLGLGLSALVAGIYFLTKDILAASMVGVAGLAFGIFAGRPPRVLNYKLDDKGLQIGPKLYTFTEFKSFALLEEGPLPSLLLLPLKRFLPPITLFYDPQTEDKIIAVLSAYLPHEDKEPDMVDRLMSRIRF